jgi:hypothetical protein
MTVGVCGTAVFLPIANGRSPIEVGASLRQALEGGAWMAQITQLLERIRGGDARACDALCDGAHCVA